MQTLLMKKGLIIMRKRLFILMMLFAFCRLMPVMAYNEEAYLRLIGASVDNPIDATWLITNPSFEMGDLTGWTTYCSDENYGGNGTDPEIAVRRDYAMTNKDGDWLFNAYHWWSTSLTISQEVTDVPSGEYELSAVVCTWDGRNVYLSANGSVTSITGVNDQTGIRVTVPVTVGDDGKLRIVAGSNAEWWTPGHENETQTFFKLDDVRLVCKGLDGLYETTELGSFTAVALNVDGLPQKVATITLNDDGPGESGTKLISRYLAEKDYDFIGVSEDFNYHGSLMESLGNNYNSGTVRATLSIGGLFSGGFPFDTDGLNLIWKKSTTTASNESWTRWTETTSTDGNQYVKKGYRHYDMIVCGGYTIDVYVLHMDAGEAVQSREAQWRQLAAAINNSDSNRPKLIIGDTNSRWTREEINANFTNLLSGYSMGDPWVMFWRNGVYPTTAMGDLTDQSDPANFSNYEVVDKILFVNPSTPEGLRLSPMSFRIEQDYTYGHVQGTDEVKWLGDHRPAVVEFALMERKEIKTIIGDVNRDGLINIADVTALVSIILGNDSNEPFVYDHLAADVNRDGEINIVDVTSLVNIILNQE